MEREPRLSQRASAPGLHGPAPAASVRLFVVHAPEDAWFVDGFLLEALRLPEGEVLVSNKLEPGAVIVCEIERGALSPVTVAVVSPAFLTSPWAQFAHQLAMHQSIEAASDGSATLVPAILADCELPLLSRFRVPLDFRNHDREHWEDEAEKLRKKLAAPAPVVVSMPCPYPGIRAFTTNDAARFHGRDSEIRELLGRLRDGQRELYVIGPSGSGKSSLVAAGLVPSLRRSPERAGGSFLVQQMRPGADPAAALAGVLEATADERGDAAIANHPGHDRLLIVVDQLEELFTTAESNARAAFIAALHELRANPRVALVLTLRADFYAQLMESALWSDLGGQLSRLDVSPLRGDKLQLAIEAPARALGIYFEPVLVKQLLHDVADEPGALPLLQDTLLELWHQRTRGLLRLAEYEAMSDGTRTGLAVTVARRADGALNELSPRRREIARRVLLRLVQFGDGNATTRRQQVRAALSAAADVPEDVDAVIRHLADRRLVTTSGGEDGDGDPPARIDLAHEVLLSAWPTLGEWIRTRRDDEQRRRVLEAKAAEWVKHGRGQMRLLEADEVREVRNWLSGNKAHDLGVSQAIEDLIVQSEAALAAETAEAESRRRRWRRWVMAAFVTLTAAVVAVSTLAVIAGRRSQEARERAGEAKRQAGIAGESARELKLQLAHSYISQGHEQLMDDHPAQAAPFLVAAREAGIDEVPLRMLFRWASQGLPFAWFLHDGPIFAVAFSPDGTRVATASYDRTAQVWDVVSGKRVTPPLAHQRGIWAVAWAPDGSRVATASFDHTARVWDARTGSSVTPPLAHNGSVNAVAWSPDGTRLATASADGTARVWDTVSGRQVMPSFMQQGDVKSVAWSPNGMRLATASADETARIWDVIHRKQVTSPLTHQDVVNAVAWSPDGTRVATASSDGTARIWDMVSGKQVTPPLTHRDGVEAVAWRSDGTQLATVSNDKTARVWDAISGKPVTPPLAHQGAVTVVAWSPDSTRVATASDDRSARVWDAVRGKETRRFTHQDEVKAVAWSPDGTRLATASKDKTARVWDAFSGKQVTLALTHEGAVNAVAWSPDGTRLATASVDGTARVWDAVSGKQVTPPLTHQGEVNAVAWSPDGTRLATASVDGTARVWDAVSGKQVTPLLAHQSEVNAIAWSPDGTRLATASDDKTARVWDAVSGKHIAPPLTHQRYVSAVLWSPNGRLLATASADQTARVWDTQSGNPVTPPLAHQSWVNAVAFSPDGTRVATASLDQTARVWDVSWDTGTLADWRATLERCDYMLNDVGVLVVRERNPSPL